MKISTKLKKYLFPSCYCVQKLLIAQVKMVLRVLFLYIPLPMFWALFDQQVNGTFSFIDFASFMCALASSLGLRDLICGNP